MSDFCRCQKCGEFGRDLVLLPSVPATLCVKHDREWADVCVGLPEYEDYQRSALLVQVAIKRGDDETVLMRRAEFSAAALALRAKTVKWADGQEQGDAKANG